jgi:hypothetical protein
MQGPFYLEIPERLLRSAQRPGPAGPIFMSDGTSLGVTVSDLLYVALTIVVFAVLLLILKGVERFER